MTRPSIYAACALLVSLSLTSSVRAQRSPRNVEMLRRGQGLGGAASPDGTHYAYWGTSGFVVFNTVSRERVHVEMTELGVTDACVSIAWSADGTRVAFSHARGVSEYALESAVVRTVHTAPALRRLGYSCNVAYDESGRVLWVERGPNAYIGRDGLAPIALPSSGYTAFAPRAGARRLLFAESRLGGMPTGSTELFAIDLRAPSPSARTLNLRASSNAYIDPHGRRVCARMENELMCVDLETGARHALGDAYIHGTDTARPFSPSADRVLLQRNWQLIAHRFDDGSEQQVAALALPRGSIAFAGAAFENEHHVLLFEHHERRGRAPALVRVELGTQRRETLVRDRQQLCYLHPSGGSLFGYRTNNQGSEDFVRIDLQRRRARSRRVRRR